jgi:hypothetical protein
MYLFKNNKEVINGIKENLKILIFLNRMNKLRN